MTREDFWLHMMGNTEEATGFPVNGTSVLFQLEKLQRISRVVWINCSTWTWPPTLERRGRGKSVRIQTEWRWRDIWELNCAINDILEWKRMQYKFTKFQLWESGGLSHNNVFKNESILKVGWFNWMTKVGFRKVAMFCFLPFPSSDFNAPHTYYLNLN